MEKSQPIKITVTDLRWNCKCLCCVNIRQEYHTLAQSQVAECGKMWMERCSDLTEEIEELKRQVLFYKEQFNRNDILLFKAQQKVEYLESLKEWRDFTNINRDP